MAPRELELELETEAAEELVAGIEAALAGDTPMVWVTDEGGRRHGLVVGKVAFVELGPEADKHGVGFSTG
jgi:hypothetical protein